MLLTTRIEITTFGIKHLSFKFAVELDTNLFEIVNHISRILKVIPSEISCFDDMKQLDTNKTLINNDIYENNKIIYIDTSQAQMTAWDLQLAHAYDNEHVVISLDTHDAHMAHTKLEFVDAWFDFARRAMSLGQPDRAVLELDFCLIFYQEYEYHMAKLGLPMHPEQQEAIEATKTLREANVRSQKEKEGREDLQRIIESFKQP